MEHLQPAAASFDEHRTCNHHPINRAINPGSIGWDEVFFVEKTATRAVVHTKPNADDCVGEIIAAGWGAGGRRGGRGSRRGSMASNSSASRPVEANMAPSMRRPERG